MSIKRSSIDDYPQHLNPFYEGDQKSRFWKIGKVKRSSSFGESLRNTLLLKSFRKKKKEKDVPNAPLELRRNYAGVQPLHRQTLPTIYSPSSIRTSTPVPLPRSRFSERVPKALSITTEITVNPPNPFDENEEEKIEKKHAKSRKRRAPLPPTLGGSAQNVSNWSLTSDCTDISACSDSEFVVNPEVSACIANITKEIERMTEDEGDNLNSTKTTCDEISYCDIPDVVVSSVDGAQLEKSHPKCMEGGTDENCNVLGGKSIKESLEDTCPDIVYHTSCNEYDTDNDDDKERLVLSSSSENICKTDSLTNLINSIGEVEDDNANVECTVEVEDSTVDAKLYVHESKIINENQEEGRSSPIQSLENVRRADSLTTLINSIDVNKDLDKNDFSLKEVDSLTNILNSINFIDNEAFVGKDSTEKCGIVDEILNCDNINIEVNENDGHQDSDAKPRPKERLKKLSVQEIFENNIHA